MGKKEDSEMLKFLDIETAISKAKFGRQMIELQATNEKIILGSSNGFIEVSLRHNVILVESFESNYIEDKDEFEIVYIDAKHGIKDLAEMVEYIATQI